MDNDVRTYCFMHNRHPGLQDMSLCEHLSELVFCCDESGRILYANRAAQQQSTVLLEGELFTSMLVPDAVEKGQLFFETARRATSENPTLSWELSLGTSSEYTIARFLGYHDDRQVILLGQVEPASVGEMQQEMLELTSELAEAQRQLHRQNRALQQALDEQRQLLQTIQELSAPIAPIWNGVLLMPLVGHIDSNRANKITQEVLQRAQSARARYVILDIAGIIAIDTAVARHLIDTARALRLLGTRAVLVGINPIIAETILHLGIDLQEFIIHTDLQHAIAHVLQHLRGRPS